MSFEQLVASVDALRDINEELTSTVLATLSGTAEAKTQAIAARDQAGSFAVDALGYVEQCQELTIEAQQAVVDAEGAATTKVNQFATTLLSPQGAEKVFIQLPLAGAVSRSLALMGLDFINAAAYGAIGDGTLRTLGSVYTTLAEAQFQYSNVTITSLTQSIDWAAIQSALNTLRNVYVKSGRYVLTNRLLMPDGVLLKGEGVGLWDCVFHNRPKTWTGTSLLFKGTGAKDISFYGISGKINSGGRRTDPDNPGQYFSMTSFMNEDAIGATMATKRLYSAAISSVTEVGACRWGVQDLRVCPWNGTDGISEYSNESSSSLGDNWDIGVNLIDSEYVQLSNVQVVGYWRMAGVAVLSPGVTNYGVSERNRIRDCMLQGNVGLLMRSGDTWAVSAKTADSVTIHGSVDHYWPTSGNFEAPGNLRYSYTGITASGNDLIFTGVAAEPGTSQDPLAANITLIRNRRRGTGFAGCQIENTMIHGLDHVSGLASTALGFPVSSRALEMSGYPMRGIQFYNSKFQTHERVAAFLHEVADPIMFGCQFEGLNSFVIASPQNTTLSAADALCPAASGDTSGLRMISTLLSSIDTRLFTPRSIFDDMRQMNPQSRNTSDFLIEALPSQNLTLRASTGNSIYLSTSAGVSAVRLTDSGNLLIQSGGQLTLSGGLATINSDAAQNITFRTGTTVRFTLYAASGSVAPGTDGNQNLGTSSLRWNNGYFAVAPTVGSDENLKQDVEDISDAALDAWSRVNYKAYRLKQAVVLKGDEARIHCGVIAQQVRDAFIAEGIDPFRYGLLCFDEWEDSEEILDSEGTVISPAIAAGSSYSIRYEEALVLEAALMRRTTKRLEARLAALELV